MNREVIVTINDVAYTVKKMPLGKYAQVFIVLKELPKILEDVDNFSTDEIVGRLPEMITTALPELTKVISLASDIPEDVINEECGLAELTDAVIAILDVNDIEKVVDNIKKIMARKAFQGKQNTADQMKKALTA